MESAQSVRWDSIATTNSSALPVMTAVSPARTRIRASTASKEDLSAVLANVPRTARPAVTQATVTVTAV